MSPVSLIARLSATSAPGSFEKIDGFVRILSNRLPTPEHDAQAFHDGEVDPPGASRREGRRRSRRRSSSLHGEQPPRPWHALELVLTPVGEGDARAGDQVGHCP